MHSRGDEIEKLNNRSCDLIQSRYCSGPAPGQSCRTNKSLLRKTPSSYVSSSTNGYEIWNRGWSAADAARLREAGIRGVLESPTGSYKYKFSPTNVISIGVPGLNNALDNAKQWTVNGGAILQ